MIFKSLVFAQASGSTGGLVYSRNGGGMYVRSRANPTNPNTEQQQAVRDAMRILVNAWTNSLTPTQRDDWNSYAFNTPTLNKLGEPTTKTGQQMYLRGNISRLQAALPRADDAPVIFDTSSFTPTDQVVAHSATNQITVSFDDTDDWANIDGGALLIYMGRPQNATRTFGKGPFQLALAVLGDGTTPPTSPASFHSLFPLATGQRVFLQMRATMPDGRLTGKQNPTTIVVV